MNPFRTSKKDTKGLLTFKNLKQKKMAIGNIAKMPKNILKPFLITQPFDCRE